MTFEEVFVGKSKSEISQKIRARAALRQLFGGGCWGAAEAFSKIESGDVSVLASVDIDTAMKYHELARRVIANGTDLDDVQKSRSALMERAIKHQLFV